MLFLSLFLWIFLFYLSSKSTKCFVPRHIRGGGGGGSVETSTVYQYKIKFPHASIDPSQSITFYDAYGSVLQTIPPYYKYMNYAQGVLEVPGTEQNIMIEKVSTATYYVFYSTDDLVIDYENVQFKIAKKILKSPSESIVKATFEFVNVFTPVRDIASVIDGKWDTQVQSIFYGEPPNGYRYAIIDLGAVYTIQSLDLVAGYFKTQDNRKYNIEFTSTLQYSTDGVNYYDISDKTSNFKLSGGESKGFEEEDLGAGFRARYLLLVLNEVKKLEYGTAAELGVGGAWVVAITEIAAYDDIVIKGDATLIPTTYLAQAIDLDGLESGSFPSSVIVDNTAGFAEPESGEAVTAYIRNMDGTYDSFSYTSMTSTTFEGISGLSSNHLVGALVVKEIEGDTSYYDYNCVLPKLGEKIYKKIEVDENTLFEQAQLNKLAKSYLREFSKDHNSKEIELVFCPHICVGQTLEWENERWFVESVSNNGGMYRLKLAKYPE